MVENPTSFHILYFILQHFHAESHKQTFVFSPFLLPFSCLSSLFPFTSCVELAAANQDEGGVEFELEAGNPKGWEPKGLAPGAFSIRAVWGTD